MLRYAFCALSILVSACSYHAYSPPSRVGLVENAATLGEGRTSVALEGSGGSVAFASGGGAAARVRRGVSETVDVSLDATFVYLRGPDFDCEGATSPCAPGRAEGAGGAGRLGAKWAPWGRYFAIAGGFGGGGSSMGGFVAPDLGLIASYENEYVVPFVSTLASVSFPLGARSLRFGEHESSPSTTFSLATTLGAKVLVGPQDRAARGALVAGLGLLVLADDEEADTAWSATVGGEVSF